ncbi:MAG: 4-hydroxythreonine-4-phosphate dehydrogenase PdxA [Chitinivibrionales bacterium]|nr:4-hydroxythreonine-4-phosphate dehydrogenase PdxA [Chitinivibrionales bacterium]
MSKNIFSGQDFRSRIALTMGDPCGIGPEIIAKVVGKIRIPPDCAALIIGDQYLILDALDRLYPKTRIACFQSETDSPLFFKEQFSLLGIDDPHFGKQSFSPYGVANALSGARSYDYFLKSIALARQGIVDGIVTCAINKTSLSLAGIPFAGHSEIVAHETGVNAPAMMFMLDSVCVAHVTGHCSIREALKLITTERITHTIRLLNTALLDLNVTKPRIAVTGLNPHAGESSLFGTEEACIISPAVMASAKNGIVVHGPFPADSIFWRAFRGEFDGVVAMLHDQGYGALKSRNFPLCVQVTIGLPFVRTSVGHGTAFDIAGKNLASEESLAQALDVAHRMIQAKKNRTP